jgi:hypothetical protein
LLDGKIAQLDRGGIDAAVGDGVDAGGALVRAGCAVGIAVGRSVGRLVGAVETVAMGVGSVVGGIVAGPAGWDVEPGAVGEGPPPTSPAASVAPAVGLEVTLDLSPSTTGRGQARTTRAKRMIAGANPRRTSRFPR